jgi:hypothetical protein
MKDHELWQALEAIANSGEDATELIQVAYDAGMTKFPPGVYLLSDTITVP